MLSIAIRERLTNFFSSLGPNVCVCVECTIIIRAVHVFGYASKAECVC
jgi:hypothetical protein